ncbi:Predicted metalloprotease, contains C-terminal PDZ domain [Arachidicoccus rhizosphaerae]|uniref:Predicted metalloprotease, contains C-terminal PDZ domain n=1 Tax=Arachidicoccus rhizosphaerae TaxID=551991 RepID=A0A1H4BH23_9BACT|nr:Predicted metalloprotease, contains C-terminal PDZ domain [Arachidicoccus rhizosphaerae]
MKTLFLFISICFSLVCSGQKPDLSYTLSRKDSTTLIIKVAFTGNATGETTLHLPDKWASQQSLYKAVSGLTALSPATVISATDRRDKYTVRYKPGTNVVFSYLLHKDWEGPLKYPLYFRPVINADYFYFEGYSGLVYPSLADTAHIKCRLSYEGFSKDDFFGNSFYANATDGKFTVSQESLLNAVFCAGKLRSRTTKVAGHQIVVALTGKLAFSDDTAFSSITNIIQAERRFWNEKGPEYYFTLFLPLYDQGNTGGTAHYHAFSLFQSVGLDLKSNLLPMIAHEYFHNWLGLGLKMPEPDEPYKWFSEGFTEYYSFKILFQSGLISKDEFLGRINGYLKDYYLSPYFNMAAQKLIGRYWESSELKLLSYRRGLILAFLIDSRIREKSQGSLDDLLRDLYRQSGPAMIFSNVLFSRLVRSYSDAATAMAIDKANGGDNSRLTKLLFIGRIYQADSLQVDKVFDLGFDWQASRKAGEIRGLEIASNAAKAGLANGMKLTDRLSVWFNNTSKPAEIGVVDKGKEKVIRYIPVLQVDKIIPQVKALK